MIQKKICFFLLLALSVFSHLGASNPSQEIILSSEIYADKNLGLLEQLAHRIQVQPFNLVAFIIFLLAVIHTFFTSRIHNYSHKLAEKTGNKYAFLVELLRFLGEVEVVFGIWLIPLMIAMTVFYDWNTTVHYMENTSFTEPLFVVVIMAVASTLPIVYFAEKVLHGFAKFGGSSVKAWWISILTLGPLLGSFITEPAAMTLCALLLGKHFYHLRPSSSFAYATLGLLFVNVSVGGVLTNFAAPPVLMVSAKWNWDTWFMFTHFGFKAILGIMIANGLYYYFYRNEFVKMQQKAQELLVTEASSHEKQFQIPAWIIFTQLAFLVWIILHAEYPVIFIGAFLFFLGFARATQHFQGLIRLREPILVGFFLAGLVLHTGLQGWWISPLLQDTSHEVLMLLSIGLTAFNDNAAVTLLATLIPSIDDMMKYSVVSGAIVGGGLTVIANAPNPAGQALLLKYFPQGISAWGLFRAAFIPTMIMALIFYFLH